MHILYCFADGQSEWNTSEWRARTPASGINTSENHTARCIPLHDFNNYGHPSVQAIVGVADVVIVQRNLLTKDVWDACDYWRGLGKTVVADLDDDYPHLTPQNPAYPFWILDRAKLEKRTGHKPIEALREGFKHVDALVSPNDLILQYWADDVPGYYLPNYAYGKWYEGIKQKPLPKDDEPIIVGWGGSVSHFDGFWFSGLREAIPIITERYPRVTWKVCGADARIKRLMEKLAPGRWIDQPGVPPDQWPKQVASFDIGLAPLCGPGAPQAESYDQHRSWLKAVEYLLTGVPWVASQGIVYQRLDGKGGFLVENSPDAWVQGISRILDDLPGYKRESERKMPWAHKRLTIENQVDRYVGVFERIVTERNASVGVRLPNVFYSGDYKDVEPITEIPEIASDDETELADYQSHTYALSQSWYDGAGMTAYGIDLGYCLQYPVLGTINTMVYEALNE